MTRGRSSICHAQRQTGASRRSGRSGGLGLGVWAVLATTAPTEAEDARTLALGRHLARDCSSCHRLDGVNNGIPSIIGWSPDRFIATLNFYRDGSRQNAAMVSVTKSLSEEEVRALAAYYASLARRAPVK